MAFKYPDSQFISVARSMASGIVVGHEYGAACKNKVCVLRSDLDTVLAKLESLLKDDYTSNSMESEGTYEFEYGLQREDDGQSLWAFVRLFSTAKAGSISYGPVIRRTASDYCLWVDPEE